MVSSLRAVVAEGKSCPALNRRLLSIGRGRTALFQLMLPRGHAWAMARAVNKKVSHVIDHEREWRLSVSIECFLS
jgi:hypothetical protein